MWVSTLSSCEPILYRTVHKLSWTRLRCSKNGSLTQFDGSCLSNVTWAYFTCRCSTLFEDLHSCTHLALGLTAHLGDSQLPRDRENGSYTIRQWMQSWSIFGQAEVDPFTSVENAHCPLFFSLAEHSTLGVDAHYWPRESKFAFPPVNILHQILCKISQGNESALLALVPEPAGDAVRSPIDHSSEKGLPLSSKWLSSKWPQPKRTESASLAIQQSMPASVSLP